MPAEKIQASSMSTTLPPFWADEIAMQAIQAHPENIVCTGITPSGQIHIGNMREVLSGDAVYRSILARGGKARLIYLGDTYDALRHVYPFLDEKTYAPMVGKPLSDIPCPCGKHESYAAHFLEPFLAAIKELGLDVEVKLAHEMYNTGEYTDVIFTALEKRDEIARILHEVTGKEIESDWSPVNPKCEACGRITKARVTAWNRESHSVDYTCECGHIGTADAARGGAKLTWRVDWPARWKILGVTVEPFGKDHASRGGSYDTGISITKDIYGYQAPVPIVYEWISLKGKGDMSSSKGNVISIADMVEVVPPDVLRYMIFRTQPKKALTFDPGLPMLTLIDELDDPESKTRDQQAAELSMVSGMGSVGIPFKHLVSIVQIAGTDDDEAMKIIERGGYAIRDRAAVLRRMAYARKWLANYAPEELKFSTQPRLPDEVSALPPAVKNALGWFAEHLDASMSGDTIHGLFYEAGNATGTDAGEIFKGFYLSIIGKQRGPRAGWFIVTLGVDFIRSRLLEAAKA